MKTIYLTPQEFINFKALYKSFYEASIKKGKVIVTANSLLLSYLGYTE
jgi:hypothetical protein